MSKKQWTALLLTAAMLFSSACAEGTVNVILNAGTTQAFTMDAVAADDMDAILNAGLSTASAINQQPWHFVAITDVEMMNELGGSMTPPAGMPQGEMPQGEKPQGDMQQMPPAPAGAGTAKAGLGDSPLAILVYMSGDTMSPNPDFDCGMACQNMVIAANALGYGAKIVSAPTMSLNGENHDAICEKLGIDKGLQAVAVVLVGKVSAETDGATGASTRNTLTDKVTYIP